jgi:ribosomal protein L19E
LIQKKDPFFVKTLNFLENFLKKKKSKRRLKKKIFKKIYLNSKISKFFKKKEQILDNKNTVKDILNNYMYSYF